MSWFSKFRNALRPDSLDQELSDEQQDHLERRAESLREKGLDEAEARRAASVQFGNATLLREESREFRLWATLESTLQDFRYAWRGLIKSPIFAATAVLSLGLAIGANTAIYSIIDAAMLRPLPVPDPERLFTLASPVMEQAGRESGAENDRFSFPLYRQFQAAAGKSARVGAFGAVARVEAQHGMDEHAPYEKVNEQLISGDSFEILRVAPALGRLFSAEEDQGNVGHLSRRPQLRILATEAGRRSGGARPYDANRGAADGVSDHRSCAKGLLRGRPWKIRRRLGSGTNVRSRRADESECPMASAGRENGRESHVPTATRAFGTYFPRIAGRHDPSGFQFATGR
jgi:hypothetical protein